MRLLHLLLVPALCTGVLSAEVSLFEGPVGGVGNVVVLDESGSTAPVHPTELQGIRLLAIDFVGRAALTELLPGEPRLREELPGSGRVVLPGGHGALYRYRRDEIGVAFFGYFLVGADGAARSVWEAPGTGASGSDDPVPGRVAVVSSGAAFLFATSIAAGGDLFEVELPGGTVVNRTLGIAPQAFKAAGLELLDDWGVGLADGALLRFDRAPGALAVFVPFDGGTPGFVDDGIVHSADGETVAFVAGTAPGAADVHVLSRTGSTRRVTPNPTHLSGAGFLPDHLAGPTLALAPDGSACAWRTEGASRESWVRALGRDSAPSIQITADEHFADTLNDAGTLGFLSASLLVLLVGEQGAGTLEGSDLYSMDVVTPVPIGRGLERPALRNLSQTSGDLREPFLSKGQIDAANGGVRQLSPAGALMAIAERNDGSEDLIRIDSTDGAVEILLQDLKELQRIEPAGDDLLLAVRFELPGDPRQLLRLPAAFGAAPSALLTLDQNFDFPRSTARDDGTAVVVVESLGLEWLVRMDLPAGSLSVLTSRPFAYGPTLGFALDGSLLASIGLGGGNSVYPRWADNGAVSLLPAGPAECFVLPAN